VKYFSSNHRGDPVLTIGTQKITIENSDSVAGIRATLEAKDWQSIQPLTRLNRDCLDAYKEFAEISVGVRVIEALLPLWKQHEPSESADANHLRLQVLLAAHRKRTHVVPSKSADESISAAIFQTWLADARQAVIDDAINGRRCVVPNRAKGEAPRFSPALEDAVLQSALVIQRELNPDAPDQPTDASDPFLQDERTSLVGLVRGELLPRYQLDSAWRTILNLFDDTWRAFVGFIASLFLIGIVSALHLARQLGQDHLDWYLLALTALPYVALVCGAIFCPFPGLTDLFCLRMPAAVGLGFAGLLTAGSDWVGKWSTLRDDGIKSAAPILLIGSALGYLIIEARINGSGFDENPRIHRSRLIVILRATCALVLFCVHSICITALALAVPARLGFLSPDKIPSGTNWFLPTIASLALVLGLLAQTLWDDAAITTPIGRTTKGRAA
jgi:hypothetical protein